MLVARALAAERAGDPAEALARLLAVFDPDATREFPRGGGNGENLTEMADTGGVPY